MLLPSKTVQAYPCVFAKELCSAHAPRTARSWWTPNIFSFKSKRCIILSECPVEILDEILTYLSPHEKIAFRLTCKAFWSKFEPTQKQELDSEENMALLKQLQKDMPKWRLCETCKILHGPNKDVMNVPLIARSKVQIHLQSPSTKIRIKPNNTPTKFNGPLYSLTDNHIERARSKTICISALRCNGTLKPFPNPMQTQDTGKDTILYETIYKYDIKPVVSDRNFIYHATHEIEFPLSIRAHWSATVIKDLLSHFDIRCCLHCSTSHMLDEMICYLYHPADGLPLDRSTGNPIQGCMRMGSSMAADEGCGHHLHACSCVTEYKIEALGMMVNRWNILVGVKVGVWQLIGGAERDSALRQRGYLRSLYENAVLDEEGG